MSRYNEVGKPVGQSYQDPEMGGAEYDHSALFADVGGPSSGAAMGFSEKSIRAGFVRKVFGILFAQLLLTFGMVGVFMTQQNVKEFVQTNPWMLYLAMFFYIALVCAMACVPSIRRETPQNYITLFLLTVCMGYLVGVICTMYDSEIVLLAVGITAAICFALTLFACQTTYDFTMHGGILYSCLWALIIFGLVQMLFGSRFGMVNTIYSCLGALLFSCYLVYDVQLLMGGDHKVALSPDEYVFAALNIYLDIINLFLYILSLLGDRR
jgi:FtsH-binding integral membrane protein